LGQVSSDYFSLGQFLSGHFRLSGWFKFVHVGLGYVMLGQLNLC